MNIEIKSYGPELRNISSYFIIIQANMQPKSDGCIGIKKQKRNDIFQVSLLRGLFLM